MFVKIKRFLCAGAIISAMASSYVLAAPPEKPNIPQEFLKSKITGTYVQKIADRIKYFARELLAAENQETVIAARTSLVEDYKLYDTDSYKDVYAKLVSMLFTQVITEGKGVDIADPMRELKLANIAIVLCDIPNKEIAPAYYAMTTSNQQAMRFLGWKGLAGIRSAGLDKAHLQELYSTARNSLSTEKNYNVIEMLCQAINFSTSDTDKLPESYRKGVSKVTVETLIPAWDGFVKNINSTKNPENISSLASPITTLSGSVLLMGDQAAVDRTKKLVFAALSATVDKFAKVYAEQIATERKLKALEKKAEKSATDTDTVNFGQPAGKDKTESVALTPEQMKLKQSLSKLYAMAQACKALMINCEFALNSLTGKEENFFASQMTVGTKQGDALKLALIDWEDIIAAKKAQ